MISWRQDGKELYYLTPDGEVMAVETATTPTFQAGTPRLLFKVPGRWPRGDRDSQPGATGGQNVSRDGQRFVFSVDVPVSVSAR